LTFAVSSRLQDRDNGNELFKATLGQIFYFSDRKVTLPEGTISTGSSSDILLELSGRLNERFRLASTVSFDNGDKDISSYDLRLNYQDKKQRVANLSFRKLDTELEQVSFSTAFSDNISYETPIFIEFELKGLGNVGNSATRQIKEKVYGYDDF